MLINPANSMLGEEEQYEIADVAASVPACIKEKPLGLRTLRRMARQAREEGVKTLLGAALELERASALVPRPEVTDEMREQLTDTNPPLPAVLVVFAENDLVEAEFENEAQAWGEASSEPNLILPLSTFDPESIRSAFHTLAVVCRTLTAASRLIDLMPGNEKWVTESEEGHASASDNRS